MPTSPHPRIDHQLSKIATDHDISALQ